MLLVNKLRNKIVAKKVIRRKKRIYILKKTTLTFLLSSSSLLNISDIPVFGVLTHADQIDEDDTDFPEFEKKFKSSLGLNAMRYLLCSSYCDEISRENGRNPNVEVPVMRFLKQVR